MTQEAQADQLERLYTARFQNLAASHGIAVRYDRDRAARDIGLQLLRTRDSGVQEPAGSLIWFQLKGIAASTLSAADFSKTDHVPIKLRIKDLRLWHRLNGPTYVVVYVESVDTFFILDTAEFITQRFPGDSLLKETQSSVTAKIPKTSIVDERAFEILLHRGSIEEWSKILGATREEAFLLLRDIAVIWSVGTAKERGVKQKFVVTDWQSKLRGELELLEFAPDGRWTPIRGHRQQFLRIEDLEESYPYLDFEAYDEELQADVEYWGNEDFAPSVTLKDGTCVYGADAAGEYNEFELTPRLNPMGERLFQFLNVLVGADLLDHPSKSVGQFIDVAPWIRGSL